MENLHVVVQDFNWFCQKNKQERSFGRIIIKQELI